MRGRARVIILAWAVLLVLAACGGGDDDAAAEAGSADSQDGSATTFPSSVGNLPGVSAECEAFANLSLAITSAVTGNFAGIASDIVGRLPGDAQPDAQILLDAIEEYEERLDAAGIDLSQGFNLDEDQLDVFTEINGEVFDDDVDAAMDRLGVTMADECVPGS